MPLKDGSFCGFLNLSMFSCKLKYPSILLIRVLIVDSFIVYVNKSQTNSLILSTLNTLNNLKTLKL